MASSLKTHIDPHLGCSDVGFPPPFPPPQQFRQSSVLYSCAIQAHVGESNISDDIDASRFESTNRNDVIMVRNEVNGDVYPFDSKAFITWFDIAQTHPLTRRPIPYMQKRVDFKRVQLDRGLDRPFSELTLDFVKSLGDRFIPLMVRIMDNLEVLDAADQLTVLECYAYLDVAGFESKIFKTLSQAAAFERLNYAEPGSWLLRLSSKHVTPCANEDAKSPPSVNPQPSVNPPSVNPQPLMKNSEILVVVFKHLTTGEIQQSRLLNVFGVGWYILGGDNNLLSSFAALKSVIAEPDSATFCGILERLFTASHGFLFSKFIDSFGR